MATLRTSVTPTREGFELQLTWIDVPRERAALDVKQAALTLNMMTDEVIFGTEPQPLMALPLRDGGGQVVSGYHGCQLQSPGWHAIVRIKDPMHSPDHRRAFDAVALQAIY